MSPELEQLLEALYERDHCEQEERDHYERNARRLIDDVLQRLPNLSRDQFLEALKDRYRQLRKARRRFPSIPPKA